MWSYEQSHPWISFHWEAKSLPRAAWLLLGEAATLCTRLNEAALSAKEAELINYISLLHGTVASASMDGNTLTEDQLDRLLEGSLTLPPSQEFLGRELLNLVKAVRWTEARAQASAGDLGAWALQVMNAHVLSGLPTTSPAGEFRSVRLGLPGVVPATEIPLLLERASEWFAGPAFVSRHEEEQLPFALVRAFLAQLYLLWINPFPEGNGRTARLLGHQLLIHAGVPYAAAQRMAMHTAATRGEHERQVHHAARPGSDTAPYIAYMARGFTEQLRALWDEVQQAQASDLVHCGLAQLVDPDHTEAGRRQQLLAKALLDHAEPLKVAQIMRLDTELALQYARLSPKTLQRDLDYLGHLRLVVRRGRELQPQPYPTRPFKARPIA